MRILVVNVNTSVAMTARIAAVCRRVAAPHTEIVGVTPAIGPESVEGNVESHVAAVAVMDAILGFDGPFDAVIQAGFGEHGVEALRELLDVPVVDITEAAASVAMLVGRRFSVVTTLDRTIPLIEDRLQLMGVHSRCASIRAAQVPVLALEKDMAFDAIAAEARAAVDDDRAEVVCLGCAGLAGAADLYADAIGAPVVDGVTAAVKLAESLVDLGLRTSKVRTFAPPRRKRISGWPLTAPATEPYR